MSDEQIQLQAAEWAVRQQMEILGDDDLAALERWLEADPRHCEALAEAEMTWALAGTLVEAPAQGARVVPFTPRQRPVTRRRRWLPSVAAAAGVVLALTLGMFARNELPPLLADYRTAAGETRTILLDDGSRVLLGSGSALDLAYDQTQRRVRLLRGEALFEPAPLAGSESRRFVVESMGGTATALGTRFLVQQESENSVWVGVLEHSVSVAVDDPETSLTLEQGHAARYRAGQGVERLGEAPSARADWTQGSLIFREAPLEQVLQRFADFRPGAIRLLDKQRAQASVSGLFHLDNLDEALRLLAAEQQLQVAQLPGLTLLY